MHVYRSGDDAEEAMGRSKLSFGYLAMRMGIVDTGDLRRARALREQSGQSLEGVLIANSLLSPELAAHVNDALRLARAWRSGRIPAL